MRQSLASLLALVCLWAGMARAELSVALFHTDLGRDAPAQFLRDMAAGEAPDIAAMFRRLQSAPADIVILGDIDYDRGEIALRLLQDRLRDMGQDYPHHRAIASNAGRRGPSGTLLGFGRFEGAGGAAVLSKYPIKEVLNLRDLPPHILPNPQAAQEFEVLSSQVLAMVQIAHPDGPIWIGIGHATPPVFDGPRDENGRRNFDEMMFWVAALDGLESIPRPDIVALLANIDPHIGEGRKEGVRALLSHPRLVDPKPMGCRAKPALAQPCSMVTSDWRDPDPGDLRTDFLLPTRDWTIQTARLEWGQGDEEESRHALLWLLLARAAPDLDQTQALR